MNIFYLDTNPTNIATWAIDAHVNKMTFESAQMLTAAHSPIRAEHFGYPFPLSVYSHPCTQWVRRNQLHYEFLYTLMLCYAHEYTYRHRKDHYIIRKGIHKQLLNVPQDLPRIAWHDPPMAMPDDYKIGDDVIASYRNYYNVAKRTNKNGRPMHKWKNRDKPVWIS